MIKYVYLTEAYNLIGSRCTVLCSLKTINNKLGIAGKIKHPELIEERPERKLVIIDYDKKRVIGQVWGMFQAEEYKGHYQGEIGRLALKTAYRGRGIATEAVKIIINDMKTRLVAPELIHAWIRMANISSMTVFRRNGFVRINETKTGSISGNLYHKWVLPRYLELQPPKNQFEKKYLEDY